MGILKKFTQFFRPVFHGTVIRKQIWKISGQSKHFYGVQTAIW